MGKRGGGVRWAWEARWVRGGWSKVGMGGKVGKRGGGVRWVLGGGVR